MNELAPEILPSLFSVMLNFRMPAFFWVHLDGYPVQRGPLSFYGIEQPQRGVHIDQHIVFLQDIFPPGKTETLFLPCVETRTGIFAELYIFPATVGHWGVLLNVTQEAHSRHLLQQKANELKLSRTQQTTHMIEGMSHFVRRRRAFFQGKTAGRHRDSRICQTGAFDSEGIVHICC
jgi:hypothetical protein